MMRNSSIALNKWCLEIRGVRKTEVFGYWGFTVYFSRFIYKKDINIKFQVVIIFVIIVIYHIIFIIIRLKLLTVKIIVIFKPLS